MSQAPFDSPFEPRTLREKSEYIKRNSIIALLLSILSLFVCGFVGIFSFVVSGSVIETIDYYGICRERRGLAVATKIISAFALVLWIFVVIVRVFYWEQLRELMVPVREDY